MIREDLQEELLSLTATDKIELIETLYKSLEKSCPESQKIWVKESEARYEAFIKGVNNSFSYESVMKRIKK